jgi:hypothetical protein
MDSTHIGFQYRSLERKSLERQDGGWLIPQVGQSVLFSPDSNYALVWDKAQVIVYMFDNYVMGGYGQRMGIQMLASAELAWTARAMLPKTAWSADSSTIAYQDDSGIWTWNLFKQAEPVLVVPAGDDTALLDLSTSGQYVRYGTNESWQLLDTQTGTIHENAIATPDERNLVLFDSSASNDSRNCRVPLLESCPTHINQRGMKAWFWYKNDQIAILSCYETDCLVTSYSWQPGIQAYSIKNYIEAALPAFRAMDYDAQNNQPVVALHDARLEFDFYPVGGRDENDYVIVQEYGSTMKYDMVDLTGLIDSPIVSVKWGQPIFYKEKLP